MVVVTLLRVMMNGPELMLRLSQRYLLRYIFHSSWEQLQRQRDICRLGDLVDQKNILDSS